MSEHIKAPGLMRVDFVGGKLPWAIFDEHGMIQGRAIEKADAERMAKSLEEKRHEHD